MRPFLSMPKLAIAAVSLILAQAGVAQFHNPFDLLRAGAYADVQKQLSDVQAQFDKGSISEFQLRDAYRPFYQADEKTLGPLDAWAQAYPDSPYAHLARGIHYRKRGAYARGGKFISETPPMLLAYMAQMNVKAKQDLALALRIQPTQYLAVLHLLNIAQLEGDRDAAQRYLEIGNRLLPSNIMLRARYLVLLEPRWGGSYEQMEAFIERCAGEQLDARGIALLHAIEGDDRGLTTELNSGWAQAWPQYEAALLLARGWPRTIREDYLGSAMRACSIPGYETRDYCR